MAKKKTTKKTAKKKRPAPRDDQVAVRLTKEASRRAKEKAIGEGRPLSAILRRWIQGWLEGEFETPPPASDEDVRAQKRPRKKKA